MVKKSVVFTEGQQARSPGSYCLKGPNSLRAFKERFLKMDWGRGVVGHVTSLWTVFWLVGGEVIGSQYHQYYGSNQSEVYVLVSSIESTSSTWWGFHYWRNSSRDMAQNITDSPWEGTKGPWFCLMAKLLLFCLACFPFFLYFLTFLIRFVLWLKFFYRQKAGRGHRGFCSRKTPADPAQLYLQCEHSSRAAKGPHSPPQSPWQ